MMIEEQLDFTDDDEDDDEDDSWSQPIKGKYLQTKQGPVPVFTDNDDGGDGPWHPDDNEQEANSNDNGSNKAMKRDLLTVFDMYRYAVTTFTKAELSYGHTTMTAWEDASFLILHELALPHRDPIRLWGTARLLPAEQDRLLQLIESRVEERMPTPYLVEGCYYHDEYFYVDDRVLIPRSFLGEVLLDRRLVDSASKPSKQEQSKPAEALDMDYSDYMGEVVDEAKASASSSAVVTAKGQDQGLLFDTDKVFNVLDLCTGSGCLAIMANKAFPKAKRIHAVDISKEALEVAKINVEHKALDKKIKLFHGDVFAALIATNHKGVQTGAGGLKYDVILCNPPYVTTAAMKDLPEEYTHEPQLALEAGADGLKILKKLFKDAHAHLNDNGGVLVEVGQCRATLLKSYPRLFGTEGVRWLHTANSTYEVVYLPKHALESSLETEY